jgi:hypothetical protein
MKVGDYINFAGNIFYVTQDLTAEALNFNEFEILAVHVKVLSEDYHVGKVSKIIYPKDGNSPDVVKPIFITE